MELTQNTQSWLRHRRGGIGSSDVPIILGISPYKTPLQLYEEKIAEGPIIEDESFILERGKREEPRTRAAFELQMGKSFAPALVVMEWLPYMRSSLDGKSEDGEIAEFKYVGKKVHEAVAKGEIPEHHRAQVQHQLLVSGAKCCWYVSSDGNTVNAVTVYPDAALQEVILKECAKFWSRVVDRKPPAPSDRDYKVLKAKGLAEKLREWKRLRIAIADLEKRKEEIEEWVKPMVTEKRMIAEGVPFLIVERAGAVEYGRIPELAHVDLEKYRKPSTKFVKMG